MHDHAKVCPVPHPKYVQILYFTEHVKNLLAASQSFNIDSLVGRNGVWLPVLNLSHLSRKNSSIGDISTRVSNIRTSQYLPLLLANPSYVARDFDCWRLSDVLQSGLSFELLGANIKLLVTSPNPRSLIMSHCILLLSQLLLQDRKLLSSDDRSVLRVYAGLRGRSEQNISLASHFFELLKENPSRDERYHKCADCNPETQTRQPEGSAFKSVEIIVVDDTNGDGVIDHPYRLWLSFLALIVARWFLRSCRADVLLQNGYLGRLVNTWFERRSGRRFTDRERGLVAFGCNAVFGFLFFQAFLVSF